MIIHCAYIFDLDGTLANCSQRLHFILPQEKDLVEDIDLDKIAPDWDSFYKDCVNDKPIFGVIETLKVLAKTGIKILIVTGRPEKYLKETIEWLNKQNIHPDNIYMRKDGDHRPDYIVKHELYMNYISKGYAIQGVFEDRKQCVNMWRGLGLTCFQVADGNY